MKFKVEKPRLLVVQARDTSDTLVREARNIQRIAKATGVEPVFVNPLSNAEWQGENILSSRSGRRGGRGRFAGTLWMGSADLDFGIITDPPQVSLDTSPEKLQELLKAQEKVSKFVVGTEGLVRGVLADEIPTLGICLGHQRIGLAAGYNVRRIKERQETGTVKLFLTDAGQNEAVLQGLPNPMLAVAGHKDVVDGNFTDEQILGYTNNDPDSLITNRDPHSILRIGSAITFQTHPEITDVRELQDRVGLAEHSVYDPYEQTHPYVQPDNTELVLVNFMQGIGRRTRELVA